MALPDAKTIRQYYLDGKWNDHMLQVAQVCKAITQDEFDEIKAAKTSESETAETTTKKKKSSKKSAT